MEAQKIVVGHVSHKYGDNFYAGKTKESVVKQIADYCREWWNDVVDDSTPPKEDQKVIDIYFDDENAGWQEGCEISENVELK